MNKYIKHWSVAACAALTLTAAFSSCSKDSESVEELMERNYPARVYLQGDRYSAPQLTHTLKHSSDGIEGELGGSVTVRLTRPQAQDVVVTLKSTLDKAELKDALKVSATEATVKAGKITSEPITFTIDKSKLETKAESQTFKVSFSIDAIKSAPAGLQLSSNQNLYAVTFHKRKQSEDALIANYTGNVAYLDYSELDGDTRATKWKLIDVTPGIQGANNPTVLFDGDNSDLAADQPPISFTIDFGRVVPKLRGVYLQYWSASYMPVGFRLECSVDGKAWTTLGELTLGDEKTTSAGFFIDLSTIYFRKAYAARYLRYTSTAASYDESGRGSISEVYAIVDNDN
nr:discoidin domain-containing protein [uncultured Porphyromonas sp.]